MIALNEHLAGSASTTSATPRSLTPIASAVGTTPSLTHLETLAAAYDTECQKLDTLLAELKADLEAVKHQHLRALKRQAATVAAREAELHAGVERAPGLFARPRTLTIHGTRFGYLANEGRIEWDDADQVVGLIRRHFKSRFADLVKTELTPRKEALRDLTPAELAKLGCRITGAGDTVLVKRVTGDVEKLITRLIDKLVTTFQASE